MKTVGIDDIAVALPSLYLPVADLAVARDIEPAKLRHGLGLIDMAVCDTDEDVVTLAAKAVIELVDRCELTPAQIGRIYVGTESSIDGSKPIASYVLGLLAEHYKQQQTPADDLKHCDVVDMTFACIGAVDAMHNSLAWLHTQQDDNKVAIVVATDDAKYELASSGEYTQGAGAVAVLLRSEPRLMDIDLQVGVSAMDVHDFFKPLRLSVTDGSEANADTLHVEHKETPVFDGQYSNITYSKRITEAWQHYKSLTDGQYPMESFAKYIFHLPYAYHGRRIMPDMYFHELQQLGVYDQYLTEHNLQQPDKVSMAADEYTQANRAFKKARTKTDDFTNLVKGKIEQGERLSSQVGNVYTASIFLSLVSTLLHSRSEDLQDEDVLFVAYGSGSKSKVFRGSVNAGWKTVCEAWPIDEQLAARTKISFEQYVDLRCHKLDTPVADCKTIAQQASGVLPTNRYARYYGMS